MNISQQGLVVDTLLYGLQECAPQYQRANEQLTRSLAGVTLENMQAESETKLQNARYIASWMLHAPVTKMEVNPDSYNDSYDHVIDKPGGADTFQRIRATTIYYDEYQHRKATRVYGTGYVIGEAMAGKRRGHPIVNLMVWKPMLITPANEHLYNANEIAANFKSGEGRAYIRVVEAYQHEYEAWSYARQRQLAQADPKVLKDAYHEDDRSLHLTVRNAFIANNVALGRPIRSGKLESEEAIDSLAQEVGLQLRAPKVDATAFNYGISDADMARFNVHMHLQHLALAWGNFKDVSREVVEQIGCNDTQAVWEDEALDTPQPVDA